MNDMFKKKEKKKRPVQEMCREDASLWTKLNNEPYLREHPKMLVASMISSIVLLYILWLPIFMVLAYIMTAVVGALGVMQYVG